MAPLVVMILGWLGFRSMGSVGMLSGAGTWTGALRYALAAMFIFTAFSHFHPRTRPDLVRMVPPLFPRPDLLVTITGILELIGALGLLVPPFTVPAALGLSGLLIAMFPANIHAAQQQLTIGGRPATPLALRFPLQLFWIGALWWVARVESASIMRSEQVNLLTIIR
jgi:uncharacterized membrane protein